MATAIVVTPESYKHESFPWGTLTWFVSKERGSSETLTVGRCIIKPGQANPRHFHPNCDEVLHVLQGDIVHTIGDDREVAMAVGDTISVPANLTHNARNAGDVDAVLLICFSSAERKTIGEGTP